MYQTGRGVIQDYTEASKWYLKAAEQNLLFSQTNLGKMYSVGQGVTKDYVKAYMWTALAAAQGEEDAEHNLEILEELMIPDQIAEALDLTEEWWEKHN